MSMKSDNRGAAYGRALIRVLEDSLSEIFTDSGKKTVLFYLKHKYGVTPEDVVDNPTKFKEAMVELLGDMGSSIVHDWVYRRASSNVKIDVGSGYGYPEQQPAVTVRSWRLPLPGFNRLNVA